MNEAAKAMDLNPAYLSIMKNSLPGSEMLDHTDRAMEDKLLTTQDLLVKLGRRAVENLSSLMEDDPSSKIRLEAAKDLADRSPETSKIQKHQVESFTLTGHDVQALAEALASGRSVQDQFAHLRTGNYNQIAETSSGNDSPDDPQRSDQVVQPG